MRGEAEKLRNVASSLTREFEHCVEPYFRSSLHVAFGNFEPLIQAAKIAKQKQEKAAAEKATQDLAKRKAEEAAVIAAAEEADGNAQTLEESSPPLLGDDDDADENSDVVSGDEDFA